MDCMSTTKTKALPRKLLVRYGNLRWGVIPSLLDQNQRQDLNSKFLFPKNGAVTKKKTKGFGLPEACRVGVPHPKCASTKPKLCGAAAVSELPGAKPSRQRQLVVCDHVAVLVFDPEPPGGVAGLLPAVGVDGLHRAVGILPLLVLGCVDLLLAGVEVDLLGAVPEEESRGETESSKASHWFPCRRGSLLTG